MTTPLSWVVFIRGLGLASVNLSTKFEVSSFHQFWRYERWCKV